MFNHVPKALITLRVNACTHLMPTCCNVLDASLEWWATSLQKAQEEIKPSSPLTEAQFLSTPYTKGSFTINLRRTFRRFWEVISVRPLFENLITLPGRNVRPGINCRKGLGICSICLDFHLGFHILEFWPYVQSTPVPRGEARGLWIRIRKWSRIWFRFPSRKIYIPKSIADLSGLPAISSYLSGLPAISSVVSCFSFLIRGTG